MEQKFKHVNSDMVNQQSEPKASGLTNYINELLNKLDQLYEINLGSKIRWSEELINQYEFFKAFIRQRAFDQCDINSVNEMAALEKIVAKSKGSKDQWSNEFRTAWMNLRTVWFREYRLTEPKDLGKNNEINLAFAQVKEPVTRIDAADNLRNIFAIMERLLNEVFTIKQWKDGSQFEILKLFSLQEVSPKQTYYNETSNDNDL